MQASYNFVDDRFIHLIHEISGKKLIVHCGKDDGYLAFRYRSFRYNNIISIYENTTSQFSTVIKVDPLQYHFTKHMIPLMVKCNTGELKGFVEHAFKSCRMILFVDYPVFIKMTRERARGLFKITQISDWKGCWGERLFKLIPVKDKTFNQSTNDYYLLRINNSVIEDAFWCRRVYRHSNWYYENIHGGLHPTWTVKVIDHVYARGFEELDWKHTTLNKPNSTAGWLSINGVFYGCPVAQHIEYAKYILKKNYTDLLHNGWIKVLDKSDGILATHYFDAPIAHLKEPTRAQKRWLVKNGYELKGEIICR